MSQRFVFHAPYARRLPDPIFKDSLGIDRHILFVPVTEVPEGLPMDANARVPNIRKRVYKDIEASLLNEDGEPGTFHLKHKGITLVASKVEALDKETFAVTVKDEEQGILDGGHTYTLITKDRGLAPVPSNQWVKFEILTNIPPEWIPEIAGGLNTSVQVQPMSLDNLAHDFDWVKAELKNEPYFDDIAWKENEGGEFDARDLVSFLTCFNIALFPNTSDVQPVMAYEKKSLSLKQFEERPQDYKRLRPILKDILCLHDTIRCDSKRYWNEAGGAFGRLAFVEYREKRPFAFPFTGKQSTSRLMNGALYPMLASFRWMVEDNPKTNEVRWRGGFDRVLTRWEKTAEELMRMTSQASTELGRNPNAIGKSRNHWANLHARVAMRDLMEKARTKG
jgi:hypothetical protein